MQPLPPRCTKDSAWPDGVAHHHHLTARSPDILDRGRASWHPTSSIPHNTPAPESIYPCLPVSNVIKKAEDCPVLNHNHSLCGESLFFTQKLRKFESRSRGEQQVSCQWHHGALISKMTTGTHIRGPELSTWVREDSWNSTEEVLT